VLKTSGLLASLAKSLPLLLAQLPKQDLLAQNLGKRMMSLFVKTK